jgi:hypothetical protein
LGDCVEEEIRKFLRIFWGKCLKFQSSESVASMLHVKRAQSAKKIILICYNYYSSLDIFIPPHKFMVKFNVNCVCRVDCSAFNWPNNFSFKADTIHHKNKKIASVSLPFLISACPSVLPFVSYPMPLKGLWVINNNIKEETYFFLNLFLQFLISIIVKFPFLEFVNTTDN